MRISSPHPVREWKGAEGMEWELGIEGVGAGKRRGWRLERGGDG